MPQKTRYRATLHHLLGAGNFVGDHLKMDIGILSDDIRKFVDDAVREGTNIVYDADQDGLSRAAFIKAAIVPVFIRSQLMQADADPETRDAVTDAFSDQSDVRDIVGGTVPAYTAFMLMAHIVNIAAQTGEEKS